MITLSCIEKKYGSKTILQIPSLAIDYNIHWIKGENGSGKTTLLKIIAGMIPFKGTVTIDDIALKVRTVAYKKNISWAEAEPLYPPFLSGTELLALYSNIWQKRFDIAMMMELLNMKEWIGDKVTTYSAGMQKKLSLALTLLPQTPVVLLDEPFITLDEQAVTNLAEYLNRQFANGQRTLLISSHQPLQDCGILYKNVIEIADKTAKAI